LGDEEEFVFSHPYAEDHKDFVKRLVTEEYGEDHVKDIDWLNCIIVDD